MIPSNSADVPCNSRKTYRDKNKRACNNVVWNMTEELLKPAEADVLEIFDWCAGSHHLCSASDRAYLAVTRVN